MKLIKLIWIIFLCLTYKRNSFAQSDSAKLNVDSIKTISRFDFDKLIDTSTMLLQTKKLSDISDSGHINIMMCLNTIFMTYENHKKKFDGGRYNKLRSVSGCASEVDHVRPEQVDHLFCWRRL